MEVRRRFGVGGVGGGRSGERGARDGPWLFLAGNVDMGGTSPNLIERASGLWAEARTPA